MVNWPTTPSNLHVGQGHDRAIVYHERPFHSKVAGSYCVLTTGRSQPAEFINYCKTWMIVDVVTLAPDWAFTLVRMMNPNLAGREMVFWKILLTKYIFGHTSLVIPAYIFTLVILIYNCIELYYFFYLYKYWTKN